MAALTAERIRQVHARVTDAVNATSEHSVLSAEEQDRLLAVACGQTCDLLGDWLESQWWVATRHASDRPVADCVQGTADYTRFLDQMLAEAVARASRPGMAVPAPLVADARAAVTRTAGLHPPWKKRDLFKEAERRVRELCHEVCQLAGQLSGAAASAATWTARKRLARATLKKAATVALTASLTMITVEPHQAALDMRAWGHEAVNVVTAYLIAEQAEPQLEVVPPYLEPELQPDPSPGLEL